MKGPSSTFFAKRKHILHKAASKNNNLWLQTTLNA